MLINLVHVLVESDIFLFIDYEDQLYVSGMPVSVVGSSNRFGRSLVLEEKNSIRDIKREYNDSADLAATIIRIFYLPIELSFASIERRIFNVLRILSTQSYVSSEIFAMMVQTSNFPVKMTNYPGSYIDRASNS